MKTYIHENEKEAEMKFEDLNLKTLSGRKVIIKTNTNSGMGIGGAWVEGLGDVDPRALNVPIKGKEFAHKVTKDLVIDHDFGYEWFSFGKQSVILDKESSLAIREFSRQRWETRKAEARQNYEKAQAELQKAVPGIKELAAAYDALAQYRAAFNDAMEDEHNDGVNMPRLPSVDIDTLEAKYPRAALYLKAESYSAAENFAKAAAGDKAKAMLAAGGSMEVAKELLDNWTNNVNID